MQSDPLLSAAPLHVATYTGAISSLAFSPDGSWLISGCARPARPPCPCLTIPTLKHLAADGTVCVWEASSLRRVHELVGHTQGVNDVTWAPDSRSVATGADDSCVCVWDALTGDLVRTLKGHTNYVMCVAWCAQGHVIASGSFDESVRLWCAQTGACLRVLPAHSDPVVALSWARDGTVLATGSMDGLVRLWDAHQGQCLTTLAEGHAQSTPISSVAFTPNSAYLLVGTLDSTLRLVGIGPWRTLRKYHGHTNTRYCLHASVDAVRGLVICGSEAADESDDAQAVVWDLQTTRVRVAFGGHVRAVLATAVSPFGTLATGDLAGTIRVFALPDML